MAKLWLQIKSDNVEEIARKILDFGVTKIDLPSELPESVPYLYFQAPGGTILPLLPINENQAYYKGAGKSPNVAKERGRSPQGQGHEQVSRYLFHRVIFNPP